MDAGGGGNSGPALSVDGVVPREKLLNPSFEYEVVDEESTQTILVWANGKEEPATSHPVI
eukprot:scaffold26_cov173-Pinguiococcus_pyrenoidosus.AAC.3